MALNTNLLKGELKAAYKMAQSNDKEGEDSLDEFCDAIASAFEKYVKSITIMYSQGLVAPNGPVTGPFNHTIQ